MSLYVAKVRRGGHVIRLVVEAADQSDAAKVAEAESRLIHTGSITSPTEVESVDGPAYLFEVTH